MSLNLKYIAIRFFAAIGLIATITITIGAFSAWQFFYGGPSKPDAPDEIIISLDFTAPISEKLSDFKFSFSTLLNDKTETPLLYITRAIKYAKNDPKVKGIVAKFDTTQISSVHAYAIAQALNEFRKSGKFTYAFATNYGKFSDTGTSYILASYFNDRWLQPVGTVGISNKMIEAPFGKTALKKIGIEANMMRRAEYKGAMESFTHNRFSPAVRKNMESLIKNLSTHKTNLLANGLKIKPKEAFTLIQNGPFTGSEALKHKLITNLGYEDEIVKNLESIAGKKAAYVSPSSYLFFHNQDIDMDEAKGEIALIFAEGMISDQPKINPHRFDDDGIVDTDNIVKAFNYAANDKDIDAIIFRINSPGGSPSASETIRHALIKAKESKKPIFVSMGSVAASGGYWIAMNADKIIASPSTVTGSIGVVGGKFVIGELLNKIGVKWDELNPLQAKNNMWSVRKPFDKHGRERMNAMLDETYTMFTNNVAKARNIKSKDMHKIAKGRVFTGTQALDAKLIDHIGTLDDTIALMKTELKLKQTDIVLMHQLPPPETPETVIMKMFKNMLSGGAFLGSMTQELQGVISTLAPMISQAQNVGRVQVSLPSHYQLVD